ncbi:MAG TPA: response regulator transcription factor [Polyangiaceae bacterium]|nr:response regulator transcription factor [Polyangiaceae bacterium]
MPLRALIIDDDARLFELLSSFLEQNDVLCTGASDGASGLAQLSQGAFDAVFLDVMMPGQDGLTVLRKLRERSSIPVIMLTAKGDETDRVVGLELGADDYLAKPFSPRELLARLRAVLRRGQTGSLGQRLKVDDVEIDVTARRVTVAGQYVELTGVEFDLLVALATRPGRVVPRAALLELSGRDDVAVGERAVDVHISHLRKKLGDQDRAQRLIQTVRGLGYVLGREPNS